MADLDELYQSVILDHNRNPRNFGRLDAPDRQAQGYNPLCGDQLTVQLQMDGDRITDVRFEGQGCAISKASASLMTTAVKGRTRDEVYALFDRFHQLVTGQPGADTDRKALGKLAVFSGVAQFPIRVKCASLSWHALKSALEGTADSVTTELPGR
ncbi:MAG: Fe-S cluster assembly sulfur transfer protein SufU [Gemmatimonadales bacterium]